MKKYSRSIVHGVYAALGIALAVIVSPAGMSFVTNHPALAAVVPIFVVLARAVETAIRGK